MVRYPKKTATYVPSSATLQQAEPLKENETLPLKAPLSKVTEQELPAEIPVKNPQELHEQSQQLESNKALLIKPRWKKFIPVMIVGIILFLTAFLLLIKPKSFPYTATIGMAIKPENKTFSNVIVTESTDVPQRMKLTDRLVGKVWLQQSNAPEFFQQQQWLVTLVGKIFKNRVSLKQHPSSLSVIVEVQDDRKEQAGRMAAALVQEFQANYLQHRTLALQSALATITEKMSVEEKKLHRIFVTMASYHLTERGAVVSPEILKALEGVVLQKATMLEAEYERLKKDSELFSIQALHQEKEFDWVGFQGLYFRLIDLELMTYAVPSNSRDAFDGGIQSIKSKIAQMIQQLAEKRDALDPNIIIKSIFVNAKLEAVDMLRSKRVGLLDSFVGRRLEFMRLRLESDQKFMLLEDYKRQRERLVDLLKKDLSQEMKIDMQ